MEKDFKSTSEDDASPLTTSTESETFDTWTLITDKTKDLSPLEMPLTPEKIDEDIEEIAADAVRVETVKVVPEDLCETRYNDDDLSDGISIISESESAGRMSPHPELRKHLSEINMSFINAPEPPLQPLPQKSGGCTPRSYDACSERSSDTFHRVEPLVESNRRPRRASRQLAESTEMHPTVRCGLRGLFYVGALLAVLAFISKLKYDAWESVLGTRTGLLTQKINELELNNNLMRAEIDILAKQVKYLTTLSENQKYASSYNKPKNSQTRENKFKLWPGNGNNIEEVEISPDDLKRPFKCEGGEKMDIAGMCIELPMSNEMLSNLEDVIDRVTNLAENPFNGQTDEPAEDYPVKNDPTEQQQSKKDYVPHEHKPDQYENKKNDKKDYKKSNPKHESGESKDKEKVRRDRSSEERDSSGERYKKSKDFRKYDKRSSMEYENAKREADGHWHEKMMQHRENTRKINEKHRHDKNWYIERGDSREQARVTEQKVRGGGQR